MITKPRLFDVLGVLWLATALGFPIQIGFLYKVPLWNLSQIWWHLPFQNWAVMGACITMAIFSFKASPHLNWMSPLTVAMVFTNNLLVARLGFDFDIEQTTTASILFVAANALYLTPAVRQVLRHPQLRWWRRAPRTLKMLDIQFELPAGRPMPILKTFDVSPTGLFVPLNQQEWNQLTNSPLSLKICDGPKSMTCTGQVVRVSRAAGQYPEGVGIQFVNLSRKQRTRIAELLK